LERHHDLVVLDVIAHQHQQFLRHRSSPVLSDSGPNPGARTPDAESRIREPHPSIETPPAGVRGISIPPLLMQVLEFADPSPSRFRSTDGHLSCPPCSLRSSSATCRCPTASSWPL